MQVEVNAVTLELVQGDITELAVDAVVNAANSQLTLGTGVAGAIAAKGGSGIRAECMEIGYCEVGDAVITGAGKLIARYVIHAVGPRMGEGSERGKLASATRAALTLAEKHGLTSIAFPALSTGVFGYPYESCAEVMLRVIIDYTFEDLVSIKHVIICLYDESAYQIFERELRTQMEDFPSAT